MTWKELKETRGSKPNLELKRKIKQLRESGLTYLEISKVCGIKGRQLVRYHYYTSLRYPQLSTEK